MNNKTKFSRCDILVGGQWGDEGKAKIIDYLAKDYNIICRYQGGSNAGHTVIHQGQKHVFHLIPSGILNPETITVLGNGMVIYLPQLIAEMEELREQGIQIQDRLLISDRAFVVTEYHRELDRVKEKQDLKIGTTAQGIGPAYTDKYSREGIRISDLYHPDLLLKKVASSMETKTCLFEHHYHHRSTLTPEQVVEQLIQDFQKIKTYVKDTVYFLNESLSDSGSHILLEGAQGAGLDIDFGTYPYVTSSSPTSGGGSSGSGIPPLAFHDIIGIFKAYTTRVGEGSLPTRLSESHEDILREKGGEFGATTGRARGCGWFDGVQAKYSIMVNGINKIVLTKLDVLAEFETVKFCTHYEIRGEKTDRFPSSNMDLELVRPVYREFPGWEVGSTEISTYLDLPPKAREFVAFIEEYLKVPIVIVSIGPEREQTLLKN